MTSLEAMAWAADNHADICFTANGCHVWATVGIVRVMAEDSSPGVLGFVAAVIKIKAMLAGAS